jgi:beta-glucosidase
MYMNKREQLLDKKMNDSAMTVEKLREKMTLSEKIRELESSLCSNECSFTLVDGKIELAASGNNYALGHYRSPAHYGHRETRLTPGQAVELNNKFQEQAIAGSRLGIPTLLHEEACHGAQWCDATVFPQMIGLTSSWDAGLMRRVFDVVARETRVAGIRLVLAPVVNIARDCRWGRMQETCGEDPYLSSVMGVACVKAFEEAGVAATPKHFVDNLGDGGRDSLPPNTSWRVAHEVYFPPFKACLREGGARAIMPGYNSFDGTSCHANRRLLTDLLRDEWGFEGIVVSDYGGVKGMVNRHFLTDRWEEASRLGLAAGVDVEFFTDGELRLLHERGELNEEQLNRSVARVLKLKLELGLFENPYGDPGEADRMVRCKEHRELALESARQSIVLLKNQDQALPLPASCRRIGLFGPAADVARLGGYSGPSNGWRGEGALSPLAGIRQLLRELGSDTELVLHRHGEDAAQLARTCDVALFFGTIREGEGKDRCHCGLPPGGAASQDMRKSEEQDNIVVNFDYDLLPPGDQEQILQAIAATGTPTVVTLLAGAPVICDTWIDKVQGLLMAWYPGEQGGRAIAEILFGVTNPSAKLPVTWPKHHGQLPTYYNHKPTGRKLIYCDNDGKPLYPFGYGLSYTTFAYSDLRVEQRAFALDETIPVSLTVRNTGDRDGAEAVQLYIHRVHAGVVVPVKELKAFAKVDLRPGEAKVVELEITPEDLVYVDEAGREIYWPKAQVSSADVYGGKLFPHGNYRRGYTDADFKPNGFDASRLGTLPPPGQHPRLYVTPDDLQRIRDQVALGENAPHYFRVFWELFKQQTGVGADGKIPADKIAAVSGTGYSMISPFLRQITYAQIMNDDELGRELAKRLAERAKDDINVLDLYDEQPFRDNFWVVSDTRWLPDGHPMKERGQWYWPMYPEAYDYSWRWLDENGRAAVRAVMARIIKDRFTHFMEIPANHHLINHASMAMLFGSYFLAIEGEEGYNAEQYAVVREKFEEVLEYYIAPSGVMYENVKGFLPWQIYLAMARRENGKPLMHPHLFEHMRQTMFSARNVQNTYASWTRPIAPRPETDALKQFWNPRGDERSRTWQVEGSGHPLMFFTLMHYFYPGRPDFDLIFKSACRTANLDFVLDPDISGGLRDLEFPMLMLAFASDGILDPSTGSGPAAKPVNWNQTAVDFMKETAHVDLERGLGQMRSSWDRDALQLNIDCRSDFYTGGHETPDLGNFNFVADGIYWAPYFGAYQPAMHRNVITVDGKNGSMPSVSGDFISQENTPEATTAIMEYSRGMQFNQQARSELILQPKLTIPFHQWMAGSYGWGRTRSWQAAFAPRAAGSRNT